MEVGEMAVTLPVDARSPVDLSLCQPYGVGMRVLNDRPLLRQIWAELACNSMQPEEIAALENVRLEVLIELLADRSAAEADAGSQLREVAASRGQRIAAWRTSRNHVSKLHVLDEEGVALCGTPARPRPAPVDSGPCFTCATRLGISLKSALPACPAGLRDDGERR